MGAHFDSVKIKACDEKTMRKMFEQHQQYMCRENGEDSYAGHIGIVNGLKVSDKVFKTSNEAYKYVEDNAQKWGSAIAVKVGDFSKIFPVTATEKNELLKREQLQEKYDNWDKNLIKRVKEGKSTQRGCKKCSSKIAVKYIKEINCPVCYDVNFIKTETDTKALLSLQNKLKEQKNKIVEMSKKYEEKNKNNYWYIGACCAS